ncbi:hypothetical protein SLE2022_281940 [Rubroshorea leprosula]
MQGNLRSSIFRIPSMLKMQNEWAYKPHAFSFGPWHFHNQDLMRATKQFKEMLFEGLIQRLVERQHVNVEVDISANEQELEGAISAVREGLQNARSDKKRELEEAINAVGGKAREIYEGEINVSQDDFQKLLLLDGCFIIELFRRGAGEVSIQESEHVLFVGGMILTIYHDLFLLENQIPWFVLELLFDKTRGSGSRKTLVELAITFILPAFSLDDQHPMSRELLDSCSSIVHIIDLTARYLDSSATKRINQQSRNNSIPCATRLREAGVKFKRVTSRNIFDVRFDKNKCALEIPSLVIHPAMETIFRNLIIFGKSSLWNQWAPDVIISYTMLLDTLVDGTDDVALLCRSHIFSNTNWLNHKEVVNLLKTLCGGAYTDKFHYADLYEELDSYYKRLSTKWRVYLIDNYFTKPWAIVSVIFASIVLVFTIMQVFYK